MKDQMTCGDHFFHALYLFGKRGYAELFLLFLVVDESNGKNAEIIAFAENNYDNLKKYCKVRLVSKGLYTFDSAEEAAENIVQDCFLILCEKYDKLEIKNVKAWMYRAADILIKRDIRRKAVDLRVFRCLDENENLFNEEREDEDHAMTFIETLDQKDKEKVDMYYKSGKTLEQLAKEQGVRPDAMRKRKSRFEKGLKEKYKKYLKKHIG